MTRLNQKIRNSSIAVTVALKYFFQKKMTVSAWILSIVVLIVVLASTLLLTYSTNVVADNKRKDFWAIRYLFVERRAQELAVQIRDAGQVLVNNQLRERQPNFIMSLDQDGKIDLIRGAMSAQDALFSKRDERPRFKAPYNIISIKGTTYVASHTDTFVASKYLGQNLPENSGYLLLWKFNIGYSLRSMLRRFDEAKFYVATIEGDLIFSNDKKVAVDNFADRALVRQFIATDLRQGQLEFRDEDGQDSIGVFTEVPESNVVIFSETPKTIAFAEIYRMRTRFLYLCFGLLILVVTILLLILGPIVRPIRDMVELSTKIAAGDFEARPSKEGVGEIQTLNESFVAMAKNLKDRDEKIHRLNEEQKDKIRLEGELKVTQTIQENILPNSQLPSESNMKMAALYQPAAEAAGDWYNFCFIEKTKETVVAIADVSGHGAGSAMFTAMIAGVFENYRKKSQEYFPIHDFIRDASHLLLTLGRGKWHAPMQCARYVAGDDFVTLYVAGHPSPILYNPPMSGDAAPNVTSPLIDSHVAGMSNDFMIGEEKFPFTKGSVMLFYTDGLTEGASEEGQMYGMRRLIRTSKKSAAGIPMEYLKSVLADWKKHLGKNPQDDDVCLVAFQRVV